MKTRIAVKNSTLAAAGRKRIRRWLTQTRSALALCALAGVLGLPLAASAQELFIGDWGNNTVAALDAGSGDFLGAFVAATDGHNPDALVFGPSGHL